MGLDPSTGKGYVDYKMKTSSGSNSPGHGGGSGGDDDNFIWVVGLIMFGLIFLFSKELALLIFIIFVVWVVIAVLFDL